jgi:hypothetical protein
MDYSSQQYVRFMFPGFVIMIGGSALLSGKSPTEFFSTINLDLTTVGLPLIVALAVGAVYTMTRANSKLREWIFKRTGGRVTQRLCTIAESAGVSVPDPTSDIFWKCVREQWFRMIDNDAQLQQKSKEIRLNGTIATSSFELFAVSAAFAISAVPLSVYEYVVASWITVFALLSAGSSFLFLGVRSNHVRLVDSQIDIAERNLKPQIIDAVNKCLGRPVDPSDRKGVPPA